METREQKRMNETWRALTEKFGSEPDEWQKKHKGKPGKYLSAVRKTPARIHASGLGQAIAFLKSHNAKDVAEDISRITLEMLDKSGSDLLDELRTSDSGFLFLATDEAMSICGWLSRYLVGAGVKPEENDTPAGTEPDIDRQSAVSTGGA